MYTATVVTANKRHFPLTGNALKFTFGICCICENSEKSPVRERMGLRDGAKKMGDWKGGEGGP